MSEIDLIHESCKYRFKNNSCDKCPLKCQYRDKNFITKQLEREHKENLINGNKLARIEDFIKNQYNNLGEAGRIILEIISEK